MGILSLFAPAVAGLASPPTLAALIAANVVSVGWPIVAAVRKGIKTRFGAIHIEQVVVDQNWLEHLSATVTPTNGAAFLGGSMLTYIFLAAAGAFPRRRRRVALELFPVVNRRPLAAGGGSPIVFGPMPQPMLPFMGGHDIRDAPQRDLARLGAPRFPRAPLALPPHGVGPLAIHIFFQLGLRWELLVLRNQVPVPPPGAASQLGGELTSQGQGLRSRRIMQDVRQRLVLAWRVRRATAAERAAAVAAEHQPVRPAPVVPPPGARGQLFVNLLPAQRPQMLQRDGADDGDENNEDEGYEEEYEGERGGEAQVAEGHDEDEEYPEEGRLPIPSPRWTVRRESRLSNEISLPNGGEMDGPSMAETDRLYRQQLSDLHPRLEADIMRMELLTPLRGILAPERIRELQGGLADQYVPSESDWRVCASLPAILVGRGARDLFPGAVEAYNYVPMELEFERSVRRSLVLGTRRSPDPNNRFKRGECIPPHLWPRLPSSHDGGGRHLEEEEEEEEKTFAGDELWRIAAGQKTTIEEQRRLLQISALGATFGDNDPVDHDDDSELAASLQTILDDQQKLWQDDDVDDSVYNRTPGGAWAGPDLVNTYGTTLEEQKRMLQRYCKGSPAQDATVPGATKDKIDARGSWDAKTLSESYPSFAGSPQEFEALPRGHHESMPRMTGNEETKETHDETQRPRRAITRFFARLY